MINDKGIKVIEKRLNPINKKDNKCFQCDVTVALNRERIKQKKRLFSIRTKLSHYKVFTEKLLPLEMKKIQIHMN